MSSLYPDTRDAQISYHLNPDKRDIRSGTEATEQELAFGLSELEVLTRRPEPIFRKPSHRQSTSINNLPLGPSPSSTVTAAIATMVPKSGVPKPGPAKLSPKAGLDEWLEQAKLCRYLPESAMKQLCEVVKECLMEGEH
jgi:hypothetical protein